PLEKWFATAAYGVRCAIIQALPRLPFRRAVALIARGLADPDRVVFAASLEALASAHFPQAVSTLTRLYRSHPRLALQRAILKTLGRSRDPRASELLRDVLRHDPDPLRSDARAILLALGELGEAGPGGR